MTSAEFKDNIRQIYSISTGLGTAYGIETCTPDGHLLGAIGQIAAKIAFGVTFGSKKDEHNCSISFNGRQLDIQVRTTGKTSIALRAEPEYLIAIKIANYGAIDLIYSGPGHHVWDMVKHQKAQQKTASVLQLRQASQHVITADVIPILEDIFSSTPGLTTSTDLRI
jgi:hypothetical protein